MPPLPTRLNKTPLHKWPHPWLVYRVSEHIGTGFLIATSDERMANGWPKSKTEDMQNFLLGRDDKPEAGW